MGVQVLLLNLEEAAEASGLRIRRLDKKSERTVLQAHRTTLEGRLALESDPAAALSLVIPLLVAQVLLSAKWICSCTLCSTSFKQASTCVRIVQ